MIVENNGWSTCIVIMEGPMIKEIEQANQSDEKNYKMKIIYDDGTVEYK